MPATGLGVPGFAGLVVCQPDANGPVADDNRWEVRGNPTGPPGLSKLATPLFSRKLRPDPGAKLADVHNSAGPARTDLGFARQPMQASALTCEAGTAERFQPAYVERFTAGAREAPGESQEDVGSAIASPRRL